MARALPWRDARELTDADIRLERFAIPRFYDPTGGRIRIDGTDIRDYTLQGIRRQIGFVLQAEAVCPAV
jgi:hypothetical protein